MGAGGMQEEYREKFRCRIGRVLIDFGSRTLEVDGEPKELHWRTFEILRLLVQAGTKVVTREEIFEALWPGIVVDESNLTKYVGQLRKALQQAGLNEDSIETLPRVGYRLRVPVEIETPAPPPLEPSISKARRKIFPAVLVAGGAVAIILAGEFWVKELNRKQTVAELVRQAEALETRGDPQSAASAVRLYQRAVDIEPNAGAIHAKLAHAIHRAGVPGAEHQGDAALQAAEKSVTVDPTCGECQGTLGFYGFYYGWRWEASEEHLRLSLRDRPGHAGTLNGLAMLLAVKRRFPEALESVDRAIAQKPLVSGMHTVRSSVLYFMGRNEEAIAAAHLASTIEHRNRSAWEWKYRALFQMGRDREAVTAIAEGLYPNQLAGVEAAFTKGGRKAAMAHLLRETSNWRDSRMISWRRAAWRVLCGDHEGAIDELEVALGLRNIHLMYLAADPVFKPLYGKPRFARIVQSVGLSPYLNADQ